MTSVTKWINKKINDNYIQYFEYDNFSQIVEIGRGAYGKVSRAELNNTKLVALKSFVDEYTNIEEDGLNRLDDEFIKEVGIFFLLYSILNSYIKYKIKLIYFTI
jgi:hypothetical protein